MSLLRQVTQACLKGQCHGWAVMKEAIPRPSSPWEVLWGVWLCVEGTLGGAFCRCNAPVSVSPAHLGQLRLGEARLAHLGGLAHGDVALRQGTLREGLRCHILAGLAAGQVCLAGPRKPKPVLLTSATTRLTFGGAPA